jgi:hypothetical protein
VNDILQSTKPHQLFSYIFNVLPKVVACLTPKKTLDQTGQMIYKINLKRINAISIDSEKVYQTLLF